MKKLIFILVALWPLAESSAQLRPPNDAGVTLGQYGVIAKNVEAAKKFWTNMGGTPIKIDETVVMKFPGVFLFLTQGTPSGPSDGTPVNHFGFWVKDGVELMAKFKAMGAKMDPEGEAGIRIPGKMNVGYLYSPDDVKMEILDMPNVRTINPGLLENRNLNLSDPIASDHIHYAVPDSGEAITWYAKMFGAIPTKYVSRNGAEPGADLAGTRLNFGKSRTPTVPTKGRALDHIGFEVKDLQAFCKKLEANGVKFDQPYSKSRHKSFASAELTDPWGTSIELTEGLSRF